MGHVGVQNFEPYKAATLYDVKIVTGFKHGVTGERQVVIGFGEGRNSVTPIFLNRDF